MSTATSSPFSTAPSAWDSPSDGGGGRNTWITSPLRVAEIVYEAARSLTCQIQFDGSPRALPLQMQQLPASVGNPAALMARPREGSFYDEPWTVGNAATVWFVRRDGLYAFRAEILAESRQGLVLASPDVVLRHCRRAEQRYRVPTSYVPRVAFALADGTWRDAAGLVEIGVGGLSCAVGADFGLEPGVLVRLGVQLQPGRLTDMNCTVRSVRPDREGVVVVGLEFAALSHTARLALERFLLRTKASPLPDTPGAHRTTLPESVRGQLCTAAPASVTSTTQPKRPGATR